MFISALSVHLIQFLNITHEFDPLLAYDLQLLVQFESSTRVVVPVVASHIQFRIQKILDVLAAYNLRLIKEKTYQKRPNVRCLINSPYRNAICRLLNIYSLELPSPGVTFVLRFFFINFG